MNQTVSEKLMTIAEFCKKHGFSRALFYDLKKEGKAPHVAKLGRRSVITPSSEQVWLKNLDQEA